jgi:hypothetical protein
MKFLKCLRKVITDKAETVSRRSAGCRGSGHLNGANGMSDMEGKVTRVGASERGQRTSFKTPLLQRIRGTRLRCLALAFALAMAGSALSQDEYRPATTWQDEMAKGIVPYHQLTVDDFQIKDDAPPKYGFYIRGAIDSQYHFIAKPAANGFFYANIDQWMVFSGLDKQKTYRNSSFKQMKASLRYAQAILDLNEISARHQS